MSGSSPPRELRSTAILLRLTLRTVTCGRIRQPEARRLRSRRHDGPVPVRAGGAARPDLGSGFRRGSGCRCGAPAGPARRRPGNPAPPAGRPPPAERKSVVEGKSVSVRVDLGGSRNNKKKNNKHESKYSNIHL